MHVFEEINHAFVTAGNKVQSRWDTDMLQLSRELKTLIEEKRALEQRRAALLEANRQQSEIMAGRHTDIDQMIFEEKPPVGDGSDLKSK